MVRNNKKKYLLIFTVIALITIAVDQLSKLIIFIYQPNLRLGFLKIQYLTNTGAGFGILQDKTTLLTITSLIVVLITIYLYPEIQKKAWPQILTAIFLGGVIGNLIDRLFRGLVIDFINLTFWPTFNVADAAISIGVVGLMVILWKN